ncbi:multidrug resistance-associated protein 4-like protein, partial [Leptotrombidium deliense]
AVDSEVANHIFNECIQNYLCGKTRILVTHNLQFLQKADKVVIMKDGVCVSLGTPEELSKSAIDINTMIGEVTKTDEMTKNLTSCDPENLDIDFDEYVESKEEAATSGTVRWKVHVDYFKAGGTLSTIVLLILIFVSQFAYHFNEYWLSLWMDYSEVNNLSFNGTNGTLMESKWIFVWDTQNYNILFYSILTVLILFAYMIRFGTNVNICLTSSQNLHKTIFDKLLRTPISFFERNPKGRILNRFTGDIGQLDQRIPITLLDLNAIMANVIGIVAVTSVVNPYLLIVCAILVSVSLPLRKYYLRSARNVKSKKSSVQLCDHSTRWLDMYSGFRI